jgi:hypothetical protein
MPDPRVKVIANNTDYPCCLEVAPYSRFQDKSGVSSLSSLSD